MGSPFAMKRGRSAIHGVSLSLNDSSPQEVPAAASLKDRADKIGLLKKLSGKGILTAGTWRQRYCLLVKSRLYFFENEDSNGTEKSSGFINLEYFDSCSEASTRISRKAANVFVIGATDKGFFESHSGRHYFAAETLTDTKEWISAINATMNKIRPKEKRTSSHLREKSPHFTAFSKSKDKERDRDKDKERESVSGSGPSKMKDKLTDSDSQELNLTPQGTLPRSSGRLDSSVAKSRARGPTGRRLPRKPSTSPLYPHVHHSQNSSPGGPRKKTVTAIVEKNQNRNTKSDEENNTSNSNSTDDNDVDNDLGHNNNDEGVSEELTSITSTTIRGRATSLTALEKSPADEMSGENDSLNKTCTPNNNNTSSSSSNNNTSRLDSASGSGSDSDSNLDSTLDEKLNETNSKALELEEKNKKNENKSVDKEEDKDEDNFDMGFGADFDRAWFISVPQDKAHPNGSGCSSPEFDRDSTSDYYSMNGNNSRLSSSPNPEKKNKHCCIL